jgi:hypothetical protein
MSKPCWIGPSYVRLLPVILILLTPLPKMAFGQKQVVRIGTLTRLPAPAGRTVSPSWMAPAKPLKIPADMRIEEPFAWNRTDRYVAPDPKAFFPDDPEGGKQLDDLFGGKLGGHHKPEEILAVVRQGFRNTTRHRTRILSEVGNGFIWNVDDQDPRAVELMYHASEFPGMTQGAMYSGLAVVNQRSDNLLRTMMQRFTTYGYAIQGRVLWGFQKYGDRQDTTDRLKRLLDNPDGLHDSAIVAALDLYQKFVGKPYPDLSQFNDVGLFVIGFQSKSLETAGQLRSQTVQWAGNEEAVAEFVLRIDEGKPVGVGLIRGIGHRDEILRAIEGSEDTELVFNQTLAPVVLQFRQLREFARFLPDGLPEDASPVYAPLPADEKFAWNATDGYVPPDFFGYFPDDPQAGVELDKIYLDDGRDTQGFTAREILVKIRRGLRNSKLSEQALMRWAGQASGWPADPMAREIAYHAADPKAEPKMRSNAVWSGFRGLWDKTPNVLRLFADILITEPYDHYQRSGPSGAILGSFRGKEEEKKIVAEYLAQAMQDHADFSPRKLADLAGYYDHLTGSKPPNYKEFSSRGRFVVLFRHTWSYTPEQLKRNAQDAFGHDPHWLYLKAWKDKDCLRALGVIQGMDTVEGILPALRAEKFDFDMALPLAVMPPEFIEKHNLDKFRE